MATSSSRARSETVFPEGTGAFVRKRLIELGGIAVIIAGLALALALLTFHADDPSLNVATDRSPRNLLGLPGAYVADFLLQTLGAAAFLFAVSILAWGARIGRHRGMRRPWLRVTLLPIAVLAGAFALAAIERPDGWPLQSGLGGVVGEIGVKRLAGILANAGIEGGLWLPSLVMGLVGFAAFAWALGFSPDEWRLAARAIGRGMALSQRQAARGGAIAIKAGAAGGRFVSRRLRDARGADRERIEPTMAGNGARRERIGPAEDDDAEEADEIVTRLPPVAPDELFESPKTKRERRGRSRQTALDLKKGGDALLPSLDLLQEPDKDGDDPDIDETALAGNARLLESVLADFGVNGRIIKVRPGPVVTLYELEPAPGTKTSRVIGLADDIARSMSAVSVRIAVIPGRNVIGIELPNRERHMVLLRELLVHDSFGSGAHRLLLALGKDIGGAPVVVDLARMPHLLVAGTTGSGKSVALNTMILSLLYRLTPAECRFIMIDPKMLELSVYDGIPHLLAPVVTEPPKAVSALKWTVREMEERYRAMSKLGVRNIASYNARLAEARKAGEVLTRTVQTGFDKETGKPIYEEQPLDLSPLPLIVVVVDEMADLMLVAGKEIESAVQRLSQMARAAGIHLIMATQRPSVDVITGTIKANFPTRISFQVTSRIDSRTILGEPGAEQLLGQGDMLYMAGGGRITRVHGPLVTDAEVERVVEYLRNQGEPEYLEAVTESNEPEFASELDSSDADPLFDQAVALVLRERKASTSFVQRHLQIGYNRAARIIDQMEAEGLIGAPNHVGKREILMRRGDE